MDSNIAIEVKGLKYSYPDSTQALDNASFTVFSGEKVAIIGPNGAGKSTFLFHLIGILSDSGSVTVQGIPVQKSTLRQIRKRIGFVFQNPEDQLFCPTVYEDVAFGPVQFKLSEEEIQNRVAEALEVVGLSHAAHKSPLRMSLGEQKSAALATALALKPEILIMDEPSSNLDPKHRRILINFLKAYSGTLLIATHDLDFAAEICSKAAVMYEGTITTQDSAREILTDRELLEQYDLELPLGSHF